MILISTRYIYIIHPDKDYLKQLLKEINSIAKELGLFINMKKTHIVKLTHEFTFLKIKYNLTSTGKIIKRLSSSTIIRERRKLKKYKNLLDNGKLTYKDIDMAYRSWRGNALKYNSYKSIKKLDKLYNDLFIFNPY